MKELREQFLEQLKYQPQEINNAFVENIKKYLLLKNSIDFKDSATINKEKQYIENVLQYFSSHKLNLNNIVYWDRSQIDKDGQIYIDGTLVDKELFPKICDIFILNQSIMNIFEQECQIGDFSNFEIEFNRNINSSGMCDYKEPNENGLSKIRVYEGKLYKDLASDDKNVRLEACENIFIALFHEIQHYRQYMLTQSNVSNKNALLYAKEFTAKKILDNKFYSSKYEESNYYELSIENDAYYVGADKYSRIMNDDREDLLEEKEYFKAYFSESKFSVDTSTKDGKKHFKYEGLQEKDDALTKILDESITAEYIEKYPILQKEYNNDGTKKNATQLVNNLLNETNLINNLAIENKKKEVLIKDTNEMYYELIYRAICKDSNSIEELSKNVNPDIFSNILNNMSKYYLNEKERRINNCKILCQDKYLDGDNPDEVFKKDSIYLNEYYDNKCNLLLNLKEEIEKNKTNQIEKE